MKFETKKFTISINKKITRRAKIAIIVSEFHKELSLSLLYKCQEALYENGIREQYMEVFWVPGSFEIPLVAKKLAAIGEYDIMIALGVIIKGDTHHFELVANECTRGIMQVSLETCLPIVYEVLACYTLKNAKKRCANDKYNKGIEAAQAALKILHSDVYKHKCWK